MNGIRITLKGQRMEPLNIADPCTRNFILLKFKPEISAVITFPVQYNRTDLQEASQKKRQFVILTQENSSLILPAFNRYDQLFKCRL